MPRHRRLSISDSEDDYSESDVSMNHMEVPRKHFRRRSISRTRCSPSYSNAHLSPNVLHEDVRIHRSASTGARRRQEQRPPPPPAVIVDIKNDSRNTSSNKHRKHHREQSSHHLEDNHYTDPYESEDETNLRRHRQRPRASTSVSRSRDASPLHQAQSRDYDMLIDQRLLEKNDQRQDLELLRQQQEIERLERQLAHHRGDQEVRLIKEEEDRYEDDISDRLRRLQRYEESERLEEEKRKAERRYRLQRLEAAERDSAEKEEVRQKLRHERLVELQRKIDEEEERERIKKEIRDEEARIAMAEQEKKAKEARMKAAAVEEWKLAEERRRIADREAAEKRDKEFRERLRHEFGYTEEEIEDIINKKHKKDKKEDNKKEKKEDKKEEKKEEKKDEGQIEHHKATWIKVHRKHLLPDTLIAYRLPWAFDDLDGNYIIIKTWISEELQEELFAHSRRLREGKLVAETSSSLTELRVNDRNKDKMYLVRKKSPNRRSWIFT